MSDQDDQLRALLRRADPAADLPPLDPTGVDRRTEQAMQDDTDTTRTQDAGHARPARRRLVLVAAATLTVAVAAGVVVAATLGVGGQTRLTAAPTPQGGATIASACAPVTPDALAQRALAFEGVVTEVDNGTVTLGVTEVLRGEPTDDVIVPQQTDTGGLPDEFSAGRFEPGQTYLVAADAEGRLSTCGETGPATPELRAAYEQAFGS